MTTNVVVFYPKLETLEVQKCHAPHIVFDDVVVHFLTIQDLEEFTTRLVNRVFNDECQCYSCTSQTEKQQEEKDEEQQSLSF